MFAHSLNLFCLFCLSNPQEIFILNCIKLFHVMSTERVYVVELSCQFFSSLCNTYIHNRLNI